MPTISLEVILRDTDDETKETTAVRVMPENIMPNGALGLAIHPAGTGTYEGDYAPIFLERHNGELRLIVWGDINDSEPTHIIPLTGTMEAARQPEDKTYPYDVAEHEFPMMVRARDLVATIAAKDFPHFTAGKEYPVVETMVGWLRLHNDDDELDVVVSELFEVVHEAETLSIVEISDGMYDLYDSDGNCLNEGCPLPFLPVWNEVYEYFRTGEIKGKVEKMTGVPAAVQDNDICSSCGCHFDTEPHARGCPNSPGV